VINSKISKLSNNKDDRENKLLILNNEKQLLEDRVLKLNNENIKLNTLLQNDKRT
jgi:3-phenylpropionate/cinnamic acid dioxygenase small subunit